MVKLPFLSVFLSPVLTLAQGAKPAATLSEPTHLPNYSREDAGMKHLDGLISAGLGCARLESFTSRSAQWGQMAEALNSSTPPRCRLARDRMISGLDRGQVTEGRIVRFERSGPKVLLVQPNLAFRSIKQRSGRAVGGYAVIRTVSALGIHSRRRSQRMALCWWMQRISFCTMGMAWQTG